MSERHKYFKSAFLFLYLLLSCHIQPSSQTISRFAEISLLTIGPGEKLYSLFGHSAIRVTDPADNLDFVYNFGAFDFNTPFFYLKFLRGNLDYYLSKSEFAELQYDIFTGNRSLWEQKLNLTFREKKRLYGYLDSLYVTGFHYRYKFFTDNCATRIPEVINVVTADSLRLNHFKSGENKTYRQLIAPYLRNRPLIYTGVNILLGKGVDRKLNPVKYLFLPDFVMQAFVNAQTGENVISHEPVLIFRAYQHTTDRYQHYVILLFILTTVFVLFSFLELSGGLSLRWFDILLFSFAGILGSFMIFTWLWSHHTGLRDNLNILWLNPLNIIFAIRRLKKVKSKTFIYVVLLTALFLNLCFTAGILSGYQHIVLTMVPFIILVVIRQLALLLQMGIRLDINKHTK